VCREVRSVVVVPRRARSACGVTLSRDRSRAKNYVRSEQYAQAPRRCRAQPPPGLHAAGPGERPPTRPPGPGPEGRTPWACPIAPRARDCFPRPTPRATRRDSRRPSSRGDRSRATRREPQRRIREGPPNPAGPRSFTPHQNAASSPPHFSQYHSVGKFSAPHAEQVSDFWASDDFGVGLPNIFESRGNEPLSRA